MDKDIIKSVVSTISPMIKTHLDVNFEIALDNNRQYSCIQLPLGRIIIGIPHLDNVCHCHACSYIWGLLLIITHEAIHATGMNHNSKSRRLGYYSATDRDTYTSDIILNIIPMGESKLIEIIRKREYKDEWINDVLLRSEDYKIYKGISHGKYSWEYK